MKYIAYRLYRPAEELKFVDDFGANSVKREYLGSNADESLNLYQFLNLLKLSKYTDDTDLIVYVEKEEAVPIIGKETKLKVITRFPVVCGRLGDIYEEQTLKNTYERIYIKE